MVTVVAVVAVGGVSVAGQVDRCAELLRLSRTTSRTVMDRSQFTRNVDNFCDEARSARSENRSLNVDLRILGIGAGDNSEAITNSTFTKYCSEQNDERRYDWNYQQYLDGIDPNAYSAYAACTAAASSGVEFRLLEPTRDELHLVVAFPTNDGNARADMSWDSIGPVTCQWQSFDGTGATEATQRRILLANARTRLTCERDSFNSEPTNTPDYVNVIRDGGDAVINIPWVKYNEQGVPYRTLEEIRRQVDSELGAMRSALAAVNASLDMLRSEVRVQTGIVGLPYADGTRPLAARRGASRLRGVVGGRVDFDVAFARDPEVHIALAGVDMRDGANARLRVRVTSVDREGFEYELYSWAGTHVYTASASWVAFVR
ncbi:MAG: H-type lectin domain-containing protein [Acidobacteria bacterium]|nr:H-type lectin domain-containing protein [Acidobacteriota bacterium]